MKKIKCFLILILLPLIILPFMSSSSIDETEYDEDVLDQATIDYVSLVDETISIHYNIDIDDENFDILNTDYKDYFYYSIEESFTNLNESLSNDEVKYLDELAKTNTDIEYFVYYLNNPNELNDDSNTENIMLTTLNTLNTSIKSISTLSLSIPGLSYSATKVIEVAYSSMLKILKMFLPTKVKLALAIVAVSAISIVIIVNWDKIKPYVDNILNYFVSACTKLKEKLTTLFESIKFNAYISNLKKINAPTTGEETNEEENKLIYDISKEKDLTNKISMAKELTEKEQENYFWVYNISGNFPISIYPKVFNFDEMSEILNSDFIPNCLTYNEYDAIDILKTVNISGYIVNDPAGLHHYHIIKESSSQRIKNILNMVYHSFYVV